MSRISLSIADSLSRRFKRQNTYTSASLHFELLVVFKTESHAFFRGAISNAILDNLFWLQDWIYADVFTSIFNSLYRKSTLSHSILLSSHNCNAS